MAVGQHQGPASDVHLGVQRCLSAGRMLRSGGGDALAADRAGDGDRAGLGHGSAGADTVGVNLAGAAGRADKAAAATPAAATTASSEMGFISSPSIRRWM
jgi:hypothetical protein